MDLEIELISLITQIISFLNSMNTESELSSLITQTISFVNAMDSESELKQLITQVVRLMSSTDLDVEPKLKSLIPEIKSLVNESKQLLELGAFISQILSLVNGINRVQEYNQKEVQELKPDMVRESKLKLVSLTTQLFNVFNSDLDKKSKPDAEIKHLISLSPSVEVKYEKGKFFVMRNVHRSTGGKCGSYNRSLFKFKGEETTHFHCRDCSGVFHTGLEKAPLEVKHPLHPRHSLQLVKLYYRIYSEWEKTRCYCCDEDIEGIFYCCMACGYAMNIACLEKPPLLAIDPSKWHEHTLALFPRQTSLTCNVCALADSTRCPFYMCPPCDFVVHKNCMSLPRVIKISRHHHRIFFTNSFWRGDLSCAICRTKVDNDYGGYSCVKEGCAYAAHSKCATQTNVWDGKDLEGVPEEIEEEVLEPFVRISDGIIQHFSHQQHHLRLDDSTNKDYDANKVCQACSTPIYFGNFYSCIECEFILHEACANFPRKMDHAIHAHRLTLVTDQSKKLWAKCSACYRFCTGFFYRCHDGECKFVLHVECAAMVEPLVHPSHLHPLFLTSKPGDERECEVCKDSPIHLTETFNCIECDYALCFGCAALPQKVRYKHDKHILTLSYAKEKKDGAYWCEVCEKELNPLYEKRFYMCNEYCCVTLHVECMINEEFYMKPGSYVIHFRRDLDIMNNNRMSRPICFVCKMRCRSKVYFQQIMSSGDDVLYVFIFCSRYCAKPYVSFGQHDAQKARS